MAVNDDTRVAAADMVLAVVRQLREVAALLADDTAMDIEVGCLELERVEDRIRSGETPMVINRRVDDGG